MAHSDAAAIHRTLSLCSLACEYNFQRHNIFTTYFRQRQHFKDDLLKTIFLLLVSRTRKGLKSFTEWSETIWMGGVAVLQGSNEIRSLITPYTDKRSQFILVGCGLLNCWSSVQKPSPLLGSPYAQGMSRTSLTGWGFSSLPQGCKIKYRLFQWTATQSLIMEK